MVGRTEQRELHQRESVDARRPPRVQLAQGGGVGRGGRDEEEQPPPQLRLEDAWLGGGLRLGLGA